MHGNDTTRKTSPAIGLRPRDAARALGIGERLLWSLTAPRGPIPVARVGSARVYRVADLDRWLAAEAAKTEGGVADVR